MSRFTKIVRKLMPWAAFVCVATGVGFGCRWLLAQDPFQEYKKPSGVADDIGVRMLNVDLKHYQGKDLVATGFIGSLDMDHNRQRLQMTEVKNGWGKTDKGQFRYEAHHAFWDDTAMQLVVSEGARIYTADFDLMTQAFNVDRRRDLLLVGMPLSGRFYGGKLEANSLSYDMAKKTYSLRSAAWTGQPSAFLGQGADDSAKTQWRISGDVSGEEGTATYTGATAATTDGETIMKADKVIHDRKTDVLTATGNVRYFSRKLNLTCTKAVVDRKAKHAVFTGDVRCYFKAKKEQDEAVKEVVIPPYRPVVPAEIAAARPPAPTDQQRDQDEQLRQTNNVRQYPIIANADKIDYWYAKGKRHAEIEGKPQARQELSSGQWRQIWSVSGHYDGEEETLLMSGAKSKQETLMKNSRGDDMKCDWFRVSTREGVDKFEGHNAEMVGDSDDEDAQSATTPSGKAPSASPTPPKKPTDRRNTQPAPLPGVLPA